MAFRHIYATDISYPALILHRSGFEVWSDSGRFDPASALGGASREGTSEVIGLLVDREGHTYRILEAEGALWRFPKQFARGERWASPDTLAKLICDYEPTTISVEELRRRIGSMVGAQGHFESPDGFGLPAATTRTTSVAELLTVLLHNGFHRFGVNAHSRHA
jgi:hypothetical protein